MSQFRTLLHSGAVVLLGYLLCCLLINRLALEGKYHSRTAPKPFAPAEKEVTHSESSPVIQDSLTRSSPVSRLRARVNHLHKYEVALDLERWEMSSNLWAEDPDGDPHQEENSVISPPDPQ
ncbi:MAG: hypothetical protein AAF587_42850 [Bacteroidota bacterium]